MTKKIVICDVGPIKCEDRTIKCEKKIKIKEPPNVANELSYVMLELHNVTMEPLNVGGKKKGNHLI